MSSASVLVREPHTTDAPGEPRLAGGTVAAIAVASFGTGLAFIVPMSFTLAFRVDQLNPGRDYVLGFVLGIAALLGVAAGPLVGLFSDRHRGRWGRRRPFMAGSVAVGVAGLPVLAFAPDLATLTVGWLISSVGWSTAMATVMFIVADKTPPGQRGKVAGMTGMAIHLTPVVGVPLVGMVAGNALAMFALPMLVGALAVAVLCFCVRERDNRGEPAPPAITARAVLASFVFDPRRHRGFALAWTGRFFFFFALGMTSTFQTFFFSQRLGIPVAQIAPTMALISAVTVIPSMGGALGLGHISDRVGRGPVIVASALVYAAGTGVQSVAATLPVLIMGAVLVSLGFAAFGSVGQAIVLDVLPNAGTQAGRFLAISQFAQKLASSVAPLVAPVLMGIGGGRANYTALFLAAGLCGLAGGAAMHRATRHRQGSAMRHHHFRANLAR